jgi:hypothetical protein
MIRRTVAKAKAESEQKQNEAETQRRDQEAQRKTEEELPGREAAAAKLSAEAGALRTKQRHEEGLARLTKAKQNT